MKITSTDSLTSTEVTIDPVLRTIKLNLAGNLSSDGVMIRTLYAYLKLQWKASATYIAYPFPLTAITDTKFDMVSGWDFKDVLSRNLVRDGGWALKSLVDNVTSLEEWMGFNTVGVVPSTDQVYYTQSGIPGSTTGTAIPYTGVANAAIKIYGDATHGAIDYRSNFTCYVREQGKLYDQETIASIGVTTLSYGSYFFPLDSVVDSNIAATDTNIDALAAYTGMTLTYYDKPISRTIGGTAYSFNAVLNANNQSRFKAYEFAQRQLRKSTDIDGGAGTVLGKTANSLMKFLGTQLVTSTGVYIDNLSAPDTDFVDFYDTGNVKHNLPYQSAGNLFFNDVLTNDTDAIYRVYFTSTFGTTNAALVNDALGSPISGTVSGLTSVVFSFDYDGNVQGGRTAGTDAAITIVTLGITKGTYSRTNATIVRSITNNLHVSSSTERNYYTS